MACRKVDINTATLEDFESLAGIGRAKAEAIIEVRKAQGCFNHVNDLLKVPGIGPSVMEQNRGVLHCPPVPTRKSPRFSNERGRRRSQRVDTPAPSTSYSIPGDSPDHSASQNDSCLPDEDMDESQENEEKVENIAWGSPSHSEDEDRLPAAAAVEEEDEEDVEEDQGDDDAFEDFNMDHDSDEDIRASILNSSRLYPSLSVIDKHLMKRKSESDVRGITPGKKHCRDGHHGVCSDGPVYNTHHQNHWRKIPSRSNPPPEFAQWLHTFEAWSHAERLLALDQLIEVCEPTQVRHMMAIIEPQFQRDFISLLPKELALYVLSYLDPRDLCRAAQTCRYWQVLAEDNLLWREKCREEHIDESTAWSSRLRITRSLTGVPRSRWKAMFMRQHQIEQHWRMGHIRTPKVLKGHDDHVITCLEFSGTRIVSGSDDNTLKVWSAITGKCLRTLVGHTGGVWSSQMAGNIIISGSTDRTLKVWNADTGQCIHTLYGHTSTVRCMHLHKNQVVSGSRDATLRLWDIDSGSCLHVLMGHVAAVRCVQYDGRRVVSGAYDYMVKVWDPETETCLHTLQGHTNRVYSLQFDGKHIVSGSLDTSIRVWDVDSGNCLHTLIGHQSLTSGMELKDNTLVSGNADSTVKVWDITTGQCLQTLQGPHKHQSAVTCLQFNRKFVITSSDDGTVKIWDLKTGEFLRNLVSLDSGGSGGVVWRIKCSNTKMVCAVGSRNGTEETKLLVLDLDVDDSHHSIAHRKLTMS